MYINRGVDFDIVICYLHDDILIVIYLDTLKYCNYLCS